MEKVQIRMDLQKLSNLRKKNYDNHQNLDHCGNQKSFYGKAYRALDKTKRYIALFSYETLICVFDTKVNLLHVDRNYINYSATTRRHQAGFFDDIFSPEVSLNVYDRLRNE
ncbi:hypothetical protein [Lactobacillus johnsonii]|uniref:DUF8033 domain-containing protein n=1 Tax=Lactobacillus johnsonii TaxID=33959 RepID=A0A9X4X992_LACJH|nr:hypothetical protein [Lactobacillus johnsonii]MTE03572.1 hypothetical protein [Lactobacillus johnsonii]